jgi:hypothetical protein
MKIRGAKRIQDLIDEHQDMVRLCKRLTEIKCDAEPSTGSFRLHRESCDQNALEELFEQLGFGNLRRQRWEKLITA